MSVILLSITCLADEASINQEALEKTVNLLKDKGQRQELINKDDGAKKANDMAEKLLGKGANLEKIYELSAEILRDLANKHKGDDSAMMKEMGDAEQNPEGFLKSLNEVQRAKIKALSELVNTPGATPN